MTFGGFSRLRPQISRTDAMNAAEIRDLIRAGMVDALVEVNGDDGVHFEARVVSAQFVGKALLARHRMVYATLGDLMGGAIHALALKTLTPDEHQSS